MRYLNLVLGFAIIVLIFIAGCTSNSVKGSDIQRTTTSLSLPPTTVTQSTTVTSTITQTRHYAVAVTPQRKGDNIVIMYHGGPDASMLSSIQYGINTADHQWNSPKIGDTVSLPYSTFGEDQLIAMGTFSDGSKQMIMNIYFKDMHFTQPTITVTQSPIISSTITQTRYYMVAFTVQRKGNDIIIMNNGGPDQNMLSEAQYGINTADHQWNSPKIGETRTLTGGTSGRDHVIVVGTFTDGSKYAILDTYV